MPPVPPSNKRTSPIRFGKVWTKGNGLKDVPQTYSAAAPSTGTVATNPPGMRVLGSGYNTKAITIPAFAAGAYTVVPFTVGFPQIPNSPQSYIVSSTLASTQKQGSLPRNPIKTNLSDMLTIITQVQVQRTTPSGGVFLVDFYSVGYGLTTGGTAYAGPVLARGQTWNVFQARGHVTFGGSAAYSGGENCTLLLTAALYIQSN